MDDFSKQTCKHCGQNNFIEWQSHRSNAIGNTDHIKTVHIKTEWVCLGCIPPNKHEVCVDKNYA